MQRWGRCAAAAGWQGPLGAGRAGRRLAAATGAGMRPGARWKKPVLPDGHGVPAGSCTYSLLHCNHCHRLTMQTPPLPWPLSCQRHLAGQALAALCAASMQLQPRAAARRLAQQLLHTTGRTIRPGTSFTQRAGAARYRCEAPRTLCARRLLCGTRFVVMPQPPPALPAARWCCDAASARLFSMARFVRAARRQRRAGDQRAVVPCVRGD